MLEAELPGEDRSGAGAVGEVRDVAEADDHQRDDGGEQLGGDHRRLGAAVDLVVPRDQSRQRLEPARLL
jgi:hypothetical protein